MICNPLFLIERIGLIFYGKPVRAEDGRNILVFHNPFPSNVAQIGDRIDLLAKSLFPSINLDLELIRCYVHQLIQHEITQELFIIDNIFQVPSLQNRKLRGLVLPTDSGSAKRFLLFVDIIVGIGGTKKVFWSVDLDNVEGKCGRGKIALIANDLEKAMSLRFEWSLHEFFRQKHLQDSSFCLYDIGEPKLSPKEAFFEDAKISPIKKVSTICFSDNAGEPLQTIDNYGSIEVVVKIFTELAKSLEMLHRIRFVHNDIKPANIMVSREKPTIIDMGLTKPFGETSACSKTIAPPGYAGDQKYKSDPSADIWGLGACLFMCLSRRKKILLSDGWLSLTRKLSSELGQDDLDFFIKIYVPDQAQYSVILRILRVKMEERPTASMLPEILTGLLH